MNSTKKKSYKNSTMSFPHLFILLLHLSLQPCNGRHLLFMDSSNLSHHPRKVDHVEQTKSSLGRDQSFKFVPVNRRIVHKIRGHATAVERLKDLQTSSEDVDCKEGTVSGLDQIQSHDSTDPLHVPHENHEEHPGFNIDYEPPRTHPPSHN